MNKTYEYQKMSQEMFVFLHVALGNLKNLAQAVLINL